MEKNRQEELRTIDIKKTIASKNPKLASQIPNFALNLLKRIIRQDEINRIIVTYKDEKGPDFIKAVLKDYNVTYTTHGLEKIDKSKRYIIASNHPLGGFDGIVLMDIVNKNLGEPRFLVNDLLLFVRNFEPLFVPINKHGGHSKKAATLIDEMYKSDKQALIFPAGLASRKIKGKVIDLEWKKNFIDKSIKYQRDIIPVYFDGRNSKRFYFIANLRKWLRIKVNLEMILLPDESFRQKNKHFDVYFGDPIPYSTFDKSKKSTQWAEWIKEKVYRLKKV